MLSSPLFRHKDDPDAEKILLPKPVLSTTLNEESGTPRGTPGNSEKDDKIEQPIDEENQATEETLFDMPQLMLMAVLYCKGSRIGKS